MGRLEQYSCYTRSKALLRTTNFYDQMLGKALGGKHYTELNIDWIKKKTHKIQFNGFHSQSVMKPCQIGFIFDTSEINSASITFRLEICFL